MIKCLLDMDGVLADFVLGVSKAHNRPSPYLQTSSLGEFNMEKLWGITTGEFWEPTNRPDFWSGLEKMPEADGIVEMVFTAFGEPNVAILTAPSMSQYCIVEKREWIKKYYGNLHSRMIFGSAKEFLAGPGKLLIDDLNKNIDEFNKNGGVAILLPRPWNRRHADSEKATQVLQSEVNRVIICEEQQCPVGI